MHSPPTTPNVTGHSLTSSFLLGILTTYLVPGCQVVVHDNYKFPLSEPGSKNIEAHLCWAGGPNTLIEADSKKVEGVLQLNVTLEPPNMTFFPRGG